MRETHTKELEIKRVTGTDVYLGLCPFHEEKTPSFIIRDVIGGGVIPKAERPLFCPGVLYHCLGCGAKGNAFDLRDIYGIETKIV